MHDDFLLYINISSNFVTALCQNPFANTLLYTPSLDGQWYMAILVQRR